MGFAVIFVVLAAIVIGFLISMGVIAAIIGAVLKNNAVAENPDSELVDYNY